VGELCQVLYVDQPRYVGFSFGKGKYVSNSVDAGKDIVTFFGSSSFRSSSAAS
jgi:carboxypeptidase C (cathepsin A)